MFESLRPVFTGAMPTCPSQLTAITAAADCYQTEHQKTSVNSKVQKKVTASKQRTCPSWLITRPLHKKDLMNHHVGSTRASRDLD